MTPVHNITNDYNGDSSLEYDSYYNEFDRQAKEALAKIEAQRDEE